MLCERSFRRVFQPIIYDICREGGHDGMPGHLRDGLYAGKKNNGNTGLILDRNPFSVSGAKVVVL